MAERTSSRVGSRRTTPQPAPQADRVGTQSPPKRMTRTTRSQSRNISDSEERRTGLKARKGAKQATPDATNGAVGQSGPQSRKEMPASHAQLQQGLSVLVEDPSVVYPDLESAKDGGGGEDVEDTGARQQPTQQHYKSPGGLSTFSGTTARISFPTQELTELSPEDIFDTLPDLSDTSDKFLSYVIPADLSEASVATIMAQLQEKNTRENKKLKRLGDTFERQRKEYRGDSYINVRDTMRRLLGGKAVPIDEQTASWRPDAFLQKANLASLVFRILLIEEPDQKEHFLEDIAGTFPQPFVQSLGLPENLTPECSALAQATFRLALEVRTQEAIRLLARHVGKINFDPDAVLLRVFYDADDLKGFYDADDLKGWVVPGLRIGDLNEKNKDTILGRVRQLRGDFRTSGATLSDGQPSGVESLRVSFPWITFAQQMIAWAGQRVKEIEIQTATHGGVQAICQRLSDILQSGRLRQSLEHDDIDHESESQELQPDYDMPSESHATSVQQDVSARHARADELNLAQFSADSRKARILAAHLKQRQADRKVTKAPEQIKLPQNIDTDSFVQVVSTAGPSVRALTPQRIPKDQVIISSSSSSSSSTSSSPPPANVIDRQKPSANQDDNWRPEDNEGEEEEEEEDIDIRRRAQASLAYRMQREAESNKENVAEIPESQHAQTAKKRTIWDRDPLAERVPPIDSQDLDSSSHESEISSDEGFQVQEGSSNAAAQRRLKPATKRPASGPKRRSPKKVRVQENIDVRTSNGRAEVVDDEQEAEMPLSQQYKEYVRVNQSAKQKMAVVTKPPQSRSAWTGAETDMLYYLITEHGTSWKLLKEEDLAQGHVLQARDQVSLKDKARNMKMDYLKAGRVLPQNFERIPLSQLQIQRLRDGGIDYDPETGTRVDAEVID